MGRKLYDSLWVLNKFGWTMNFSNISKWKRSFPAKYTMFHFGLSSSFDEIHTATLQCYENGKTRKNRQLNEEGCILDGQFVHHPEMYKFTTIMMLKTFRGSGLVEKTGYSGNWHSGKRHSGNRHSGKSRTTQLNNRFLFSLIIWADQCYRLPPFCQMETKKNTWKI